MLEHPSGSGFDFIDDLENAGAETDKKIGLVLKDLNGNLQFGQITMKTKASK